MRPQPPAGPPLPLLPMAVTSSLLSAAGRPPSLEGPPPHKARGGATSIPFPTERTTTTTNSIRGMAKTEQQSDIYCHIPPRPCGRVDALVAPNLFFG